MWWEREEVQLRSGGRRGDWEEGYGGWNGGLI